MQLAIPTDIESPRQWLRVEWLAVLAVALVATGLAGLPGLLAGVVLAASAARLPAEYTFALGQFALAAAGPEPRALAGSPAPTLALLAGGQLALVALLVAPTGDDRPPTALAAGTALVVLALGWAVAWMRTQWSEPGWLVAAGLAGGMAAVAYAVHAYERWQVAPAPETTQTAADHE